jgi:MoxR-like ATPase
MREEIRHIQAQMEGAAYITDPAISTAVHLATTLRKPLLVEGHAGVGKTEIAKVLARVRATNLIRLQCYEGLDASTALYEWNYPKQILRIRLEERERDERSMAAKEADIFSEQFLLKRPLLQAISQPDRAPVLLIDEIDRADVEFESFLLEVLSDFQVTVPEIGTITAAHRPDVVLTSNRSRDLSDALRRRCLYLWIDYPSFDKEVRILRAKVPGINERLASQIARVMHNLRRRQLQKVPGVAESLDWGGALVALHADHLDAELVRETLGCVLKEVDDVKRIEADLAAGRLSELLEG